MGKANVQIRKCVPQYAGCKCFLTITHKKMDLLFINEFP